MQLHTLFLFLSKSVLIAALLYAYYLLFLKNKRMHSYNRYYLLLSVAISIVAPFIHIEWYGLSTITPHTAITLLQAMNTAGQDAEPVYKTGSYMTLPAIALAITLLVSTVLLVILMARIIWIYRIKRKSEVVRMGKIDIVYTRLDKAPFSFLNNLFWNRSIDMDGAAGRKIYEHELAHIQQRHTIDKLYMQVALIVCWMNPVYWLIQKELSLIHEFIADEAAIEDNDTEAFAEMLLTSHYGKMFPDIIQPFFYSPIKRRLIMLQTSKRTKYARLRRTMVLPLVCATVALCSFTISNKPIVRAEKKIVMVLDAGHGGNETGGEGSGLVEKDMTLKITNKIAQLAQAYNIEVMPTRKDDNYVSLVNRAEKAHEAAADIFISIHINKSVPGDVKANDYQVYLDKKNSKYAESDLLASSIISKLNGSGKRTELSNKGLYVLKNVDIPAVLIECGNIDDAQEMAGLNDNEQLEKICGDILAGVVNFENNAHN